MWYAVNMTTNIGGQDYILHYLATFHIAYFQAYTYNASFLTISAYICTFLLLLIFLLEAMVGILAYVYKNQVEVDLNHNLDNTFIEKYGISLSVTFSINKMQQEYKCCGATSFENWDKSRWRKESNTTNLVPDSCCKTMDIGCGQSNHPSNISYTGCIHKFTAELKKQLDIIFAVGLGISVIQIFGMILTCFLYFKLKRDDD